MHKLFIYILLLLLCNFALAQQKHEYHGKATFYSKKFNGRRTYSGERFNSNKYTAAHRNFPLQSLVRVTNPRNNKSVIVRINDRFKKKNFIDLSLIAARQIDIVRQGTAKVYIQLLDNSFMQEYINQTFENIPIESVKEPDENSVSEDTAQQFYIRLASFKFKKNAALMVMKQLPEKYKNVAIIQRTKYKGKPLFKVYVGPYTTKEKANKVKVKLKSKFKDAVILNNINMHSKK